MRLKGKITRWDDDRGFGFIAGHGDEGAVFVHIKAFSGTSRRPKNEDAVFYEIASGTNGNTRAEHVRFADQPELSQQSTGRPRRGRWPVMFVALYACFLVASAFFSRLPWLVVGVYAVMSLVTFLAYGLDKSAAQRGKWRTPESTLQMLALAGGWPGGLAGQRLLRHKSSKQKFLIVFWATVILNVGAIVYVVWSGDANFVQQLIEGVRRLAN